jgi:hypothetical protein
VGVPRRLDEVTADWIGRALRQDGIDIEDPTVEVRQIAVGEGFAGHLARVVIDAAGRPPFSVVVKIPSPEPGAQLLGTMLRLYEREHHFYRELAPTLDVRTPRCHLAETDGEGGYVLVLEDLAGKTVGDQIAGPSQEQAIVAVEWLARLHASGWGRFDDPAHLPWLPRADDPLFAGMQTLAGQTLGGYLSTFAADLSPFAAAYTTTAVDRYVESMVCDLTPATLCHVDFRLDNMFFDEAGVIVFDWQGVGAISPFYDLMYFVGGSLTVEQRRAWEQDLLERYRRVLNDHAPAQLSADDLDGGIRHVLPALAAFAPCVTGTLDIDVNERAQTLARSAVQRIAAMVEDHGR